MDQKCVLAVIFATAFEITKFENKRLIINSHYTVICNTEFVFSTKCSTLQPSVKLCLCLILRISLHYIYDKNFEFKKE